MTRVLRLIRADERGATAIEYSLIAGLIALALIVASQGVGSALIEIFNDVAAGFKGS
jgi:pilus assembly protein Flp/PilA